MRLACVGRVCEVVAAELPILRACGTAPYVAASAEPRARSIADIVREPLCLCSPYATLTVTADARTGLPSVAVAQYAAPPAQLQCAALDRCYTDALRDGAPAFFALTRQLVAHHEALMRAIDEAVGVGTSVGGSGAVLEQNDVLRALFHMYADLVHGNNSSGREDESGNEDERTRVSAVATPTGVCVTFMRTPEAPPAQLREGLGLGISSIGSGSYSRSRSDLLATRRPGGTSSGTSNSNSSSGSGSEDGEEKEFEWKASVELEPRTIPDIAPRQNVDPAALHQLAQCYPPGLGIVLETHMFVLALRQPVATTRAQLVHLLELAYPRFSAEALRRHYVPLFSQGPPQQQQGQQQGQQQQSERTAEGMYERLVCGLAKGDEVAALHTAGPAGRMRATLAVPTATPVFVTSRLPYVPTTAAATLAALQRIVAFNRLLESCFRAATTTGTRAERDSPADTVLEVGLARYCTEDAAAPYVLDIAVRRGANACTLAVAVGLGARVSVTVSGDNAAMAARLSATANRTLSVPQVVAALFEGGG